MTPPIHTSGFCEHRPSSRIALGDRFLLNDNGAVTQGPAADKIADPDFYNVTSPQFAVDSKVEQRPVTQALMFIQKEPNGPYIAWSQWTFGANDVARIPRLPLLDGRIEI
jgi:hypothetical protein